MYNATLSLSGSINLCIVACRRNSGIIKLMRDKKTLKDKPVNEKNDKNSTFDKVIGALLGVPVRRAGTNDKKKKSKKQDTQKK